MRRVLAPLIAVGVAYAGGGIALIVLPLLEGEMWQHENALYEGEVLLAWSVLAIACLAVSCTILVLTKVALWARVVVIGLNVALIPAIYGALAFSMIGYQDYATGAAAYDTAVQVCGHDPVVVETGWGGGYILPGGDGYDRQKYTSHQHLTFGETRFYCSADEAFAHGYRQLP